MYTQWGTSKRPGDPLDGRLALIAMLMGAAQALAISSAAARASSSVPVM